MFETDAEYQERVRCVALGLESPSPEQWRDWADYRRKYDKEHPVEYAADEDTWDV